MKQNKVPKNKYINGEPSPYRKNPYKDDVLYTQEGQWRYPGQVTKVPSSDITMHGVLYPVLGVDNLGNQQMMIPNMNYHFPGQNVTEYPVDLSIRGNLKNLHGTVGANFGNNRLEFNMGTPTNRFDPSFDIKYTRTFNYGGDPSLPALTGHYPFGGMYTKTHTHFKKGGWLDELQKGGPNTTEESVNAEAAAMTEDQLFDRYLQLKEELEKEKSRVSKVRGSILPAAEALDKADSELKEKYPEAYKIFQQSRGAQSPAELKKLIQKYPQVLKDVLPDQGSYNLLLKDPKKYTANDELYCTPYGCFTYQKAGAQDVPTIAGNFGFVEGVRKGTLPFKEVPASEAEPGDMAIVFGKTVMDYRDPSKGYGIRPHHTTVLASKPDFDKKGNVIGFQMYNADEGSRLSYKKDYRKPSDPRRMEKDSGYKFYRYIGQTPKYEQELEDLKSKIQFTPIESIPVTSLPYSIEEPELSINQVGGYNIKPYKAAAETSGIYHKNIPSLDTLKKAAAARANRPWNEWSTEEKEQYIKNPPKNMTSAQAEQWNQRAEQWSLEQAKKEKTEEHVQKGVKAALVDNPLWNTAVSFTPIGALGSLMKGAVKAGPDVYKTIKNPTSAANYLNIADDVLSMAHIPEAGVGFKNLAALKRVKVLGPEVGDIKKAYSTEKKFDIDEDEENTQNFSGMTKKQITDHINKFYNPSGVKFEVKKAKKPAGVPYDPQAVLALLAASGTTPMQMARTTPQNSFVQPGPSMMATPTTSYYAFGGGWLDDMEEEYKRGGSKLYTPAGLKKKAREKGTSKNIQSSINKIFLRNYDIFGPSGRNIYNPNSKYEQGGGWLDNLD